MAHMVAGHYLHEDCILSAWCCDDFYIGIGLKPVYGFIGGLPFSVIETSGDVFSAVYCLRLSQSWGKQSMFIWRWRFIKMKKRRYGLSIPNL